MPFPARHALRRPRRAAVLPGLLILAAGSALGGLAVLPGPAAAESSNVQPAALVAEAVPSPASLADQQAAAELAQAVARERLEERAAVHGAVTEEAGDDR